MTRPILKTIVLAVLLLPLLCGVAAAQKTRESWGAARTAVVDIQKVIELSRRGQEARQRFNVEIKEQQKKIQSYEEELRQMEQDFQNKASMLSEDELAEYGKHSRERVKDLRRRGEDIREELVRMERKLTEGLVAEIRDVAQAIARREGIDLILEKGALGSSFISASVDLTPLVVQTYDARDIQQQGR